MLETLKPTLLPVLVSLSFCANADSALKYFATTKHYYKRYDTTMSWDRAKSFCETKGGYLAVINSKAENDFVFNLAAQRQDIKFLTWIGAEKVGIDANQKPIFRWVNGEPFAYNNIDPNNSPYWTHGPSDWEALVINNGSYGFNSNHYWNTGTNSGQGVSSWSNGGLTQGPSAIICELIL